MGRFLRSDLVGPVTWHVDMANEHRGAILCSLLLFVLSGRRILKIRRRVHQAQALQEAVEPVDRKVSLIDLRKFSFSKAQHLERVESLPHRQNTSTEEADEECGLEIVRTVSDRAARPSFGSSVALQNQSPQRRVTRFDAMHWKYTRFAFLCTMVLLITWIPISATRVYNNIFSKNHPIYGLYFASALCIPLHGFGNFVIYVHTSWNDCKGWVRSMYQGMWKWRTRPS